jgi:predicted DNA-binding transcriptional regulator YafY
MGKRSATETVAGIFQRFLSQPEWTQADLARSLGISVRATRSRLEELAAEGLPLERVEQPPHVVWRVPAGWCPGAVQLPAGDVGELLRQLLQAPASEARNALIDRIVRAAPRTVVPAAVRAAVDAPPRSDEEATWLPIVMTAAMERRCLLLRYASASTGNLSWRNVSPQRVETGPPARMLAWCHEAAELRWFRVDRIARGMIDSSVAFVRVDPAEVERCRAESLDGFHQAVAVVCAFSVLNPDARWVRRNLPGAGTERYTIDDTAEGIRVTLRTSAVVPLARFVVGLGESARAESEPLAAEVTRLARGALRGG